MAFPPLLWRILDVLLLRVALLDTSPLGLALLRLTLLRAALRRRALLRGVLLEVPLSWLALMWVPLLLTLRAPLPWLTVLSLPWRSSRVSLLTVSCRVTEFTLVTPLSVAGVMLLPLRSSLALLTGLGPLCGL